MRAPALLLTALCLSLGLSGCGASPAGFAAARGAAGLQARVDTTRHRHALVVPASVMSNVDDYIERLDKTYNDKDAGRSVHYGITLHASANKFKREFTAQIDKFNPRAKAESQTFLLDEDATPGDMAYYLVVTANVVTESKNGLKTDELPEFYVSDYGQNFHVVVK